MQPFYKKSHLLFFIISVLPLLSSGEGTKQLLPDSTVSEAGLYIDNSFGTVYTNFALAGCPANYRLYIHVKNVGETILFGFESFYSSIPFTLRKPNGTAALTGIVPYMPSMTGYIEYYHQAILGPYPSYGGYTPLSYKVTSITDTGNYYFEIPTSITYAVEFDMWDFQVVSGQHNPEIPSDAINGRVWSQAWQVYASLGYGPSDYSPFNGVFDVYSDDGIVTKLAFSNAAVGVVDIFCNPYGCLNTGNFPTDRQSNNANTFLTFPAIAQYKVFLNNPDSTVYPDGFYGEIIGTPYMIPDPNYPPCSGEKYIVVDVDKSGKVQVELSFPYGAPGTNVSLYADVIPGVNDIFWDGLDGQSNPVPDGTQISVNVQYMNGLTNLPVWDQEMNPDGFIITLVRPSSIYGMQPPSFWDDSQLVPNTSGDPCNNPPQTTNFTGCTPGSMPGYIGCHPWQPIDGYCHNKMINTWWYGSTVSTNFICMFSGTVPTPVGHGASHCGPDSLKLHATVLNNETVDWYTVPSGGSPVLIGDTSFTTPWLTVTTTYYAEARNDSSGCESAARVPVVATIYPLPVPVLAGPSTLCAGSAGNLYSTQPGMTGYTWNVSAGGTITAGGTSTSNTVTVTWNVAGLQTVSVNYTNNNGCRAANATVFNITVNPRPSPTITGPASICVGTSGNVYTTETGMTNYSWNVSSGGTVTGGGSPVNNTVTVTWNSVGPQTVSVNYYNSYGCTAVNPSVYNVTVNPLPVPSISGPPAACAGSTGNIYTTQPGMTNYSWAVSSGGLITAGGTSASNTVTVTWTTAGNQTVSVNYFNTFGCTAVNATIFNVIVNPLPIPSLAGPSPLCAGSAGNIYTTQPGMSNYTWNVSAGGTVTAGGTSISNTVTVTWNVAGLQTVSVNYTNSNGCRAANSTVFNITVNPRPSPTIAGPASLCVGTTGNVYTTESGMANYSWNVSAGGTITAGGTSASNTVTVTWNTIGAQWVYVNYFNSYGCTAANPVVYNVTVNPLPVPSISGPATMCAGTAGNMYITQPGMTNYSWSVSSGGIITAGGTPGSNTVTVTWIMPGSQTVSVNYTNANGCTALTPGVYTVTVNPLPVPSITGPYSSCVGVTGQIYMTQSGMNNYIWNVSSGGTITAGGTSTSNSVTVTWNTVGLQTISVNYTNANGCIGAAPGVANVTVHSLPIPSLAGPGFPCVGSTGNVYSTQAGMSDYMWSVSMGGTILAGGTPSDNYVQVVWDFTGAQTVSVNYTDQNGCTATGPAIFTVDVEPLPVPTITGPDSSCIFSTNNVYTTESGMSAYIWSVSSGGTITAGSGTNSITVTWNSAGQQSVSVLYTDQYGCTASTPTLFNVTVNPLPGSPGIITGPSPVCTGAKGLVYMIPPVNDVVSYLWALPVGFLITSGGGTNTIIVDLETNASSGNIIVYATNLCGSGSPSPPFPVIVNKLPAGNAGPDGSTCQVSPFTVTQATASDYSGLHWYSSGTGTFTGTSTLTPTYTPPQGEIGQVTLTLIIFGNTPCGNDTSGMVLEIEPKAIVNAGSDLKSCGQAPVLISGSSASNYQSLLWTTSGSGSFDDQTILHPTYFPGSSDVESGSVVLTLHASSAEPCSPDSGMVLLTIMKPVYLNTGPDTSVCQDVPFQLSKTIAMNYSTVTWSSTGDGTFNDPNSINPVYTPGNGDVLRGKALLIVTAAGVDPCPAEVDTLILTIIRKPAVSPGPDGFICQGMDFPVAGVTASYFTYFTWDYDGQGILSGTNTLSPVYTPGLNETGTVNFTLKVFGDPSCHDSMVSCHMKVNIYTPVKVNAGEDQAIGYDSTAILQAVASGGTGIYSYKWKPSSLVLYDTARAPRTIPLIKDTIFIVTATDNITGCSASDTIKIIVGPGEGLESCIIVHNVITPNGDGFNDTWIIDCIGNFPDNTVQIFNRWGELVNSYHHYDNVSQVWDGRNFNGNLLPDGTYYYVLQIKDEKTLTGWVLLRCGLK